jgi:hypothetical protein
VVTVSQTAKGAVTTLILSLITAAVLGLAGWVNSTSARVAVVENQQENDAKTLDEIKDDVKELLRRTK